MKPHFFIENLEFNDLAQVDLKYNDIIVFVGANNSGKSASLKETFAKLKNRKDPSKVVKDIKINKHREDQEILEYLELNSVIESGSNKLYKGLGYSIFESNLKYFLSNFAEGINDLTQLFSNFVATETRLSSSNPAENLDFTKNAYSHPIHFLYRDDSIESEFSNYFKQAFNTDLIVHRGAGSRIPLYVGDKPTLSAGEDRVSKSYIDRLEQLDLLHEQGDGMRSFVGVLLNSFISSHNMLFIDEPEAFLHPPQARFLGKMLSNNLPIHKQLFLSTHSEDFLKGLLESTHDRLKIIRLDRVGNVNKINLLHSSDINEIWKDSLLRHSNILSGLFHKKVVICESDSDCRFYSAVLEAITDKEQIPNTDILFIHCGGKHRIPVVVKALQKLNVPTLVVTDFDVLNNESPLKHIFENLGGDWDNVKDRWKIVKQKIEEKRPELLTDDVKTGINNILNSITDRSFPKEQSSNIQNILKKASPWSEAKSNGVSYIPSGDPTKLYNEIKIEFEKRGLFIVEVGELENYDKTIGNHGPKWVNEVLQKDLYSDPDLEQARLFVRKLM